MVTTVPMLVFRTIMVEKQIEKTIKPQKQLTSFVKDDEKVNYLFYFSEQS